MGFFDRWFGGNKHLERELPASDLEFFNSLTGKLQIELSAPAELVAPNLLNLKTPPDAEIVGVKLSAEVYEKAKKEFRDLTHDEWNSVAFRGDEILLRNDSDRVVSH